MSKVDYLLLSDLDEPHPITIRATLEAERLDPVRFVILLQMNNGNTLCLGKGSTQQVKSLLRRPSDRIGLEALV